MSGIQISELPIAPSSQLTDILPAVQSGVTYQETLAQIAALLGITGGISATINQILYESSANTVSGLSTSNNGVLITNSSGVPAITHSLTVNTFIPTLTGSTTNPTSITYTIQNGFYTQLGNLIIFSVNIVISAVTIGPAAGNLQITGLPTAKNTTGQRWINSCFVDNLTTSASVINLTSEIVENTNILILNQSFNNNSSIILPITALNNTSAFQLSGIYLGI